MSATRDLNVERHDGGEPAVCVGQWCCGCAEHPIGKPWGWNVDAWVEHMETCPRAVQDARAVASREATRGGDAMSLFDDPTAYLCETCGRLSHDPSGNCEHSAPVALYALAALPREELIEEAASAIAVADGYNPNAVDADKWPATAALYRKQATAALVAIGLIPEHATEPRRLSDVLPMMSREGGPAEHVTPEEDHE